MHCRCESAVPSKASIQKEMVEEWTLDDEEKLKEYMEAEETLADTAAYNEPQLTAIRGALTRRLTLIQGPPGTGKTTTAGSIGLGFVHQCRSISTYCKVLATAFSNVGADNLVETFLRLGLKVVRVGKPSGVSDHLWSYTLDAAIQRDLITQKALKEANKATGKLIRSTSNDDRRKNKGSFLVERMRRDEATAAVKASIRACNIAATKALCEATLL